MNTPDFVTVAEASKALGIAPRQVRRYAAKLGTGDTRRDTGTGTGTPVLLVRLEAIRAMREGKKVPAGAQGQGTRERGQGQGHEDKRIPVPVPVLEELQRERDDWANVAVREEERRVRADAEVVQLRARLVELENKNAALLTRADELQADRDRWHQAHENALRTLESLTRAHERLTSPSPRLILPQGDQSPKLSLLERLSRLFKYNQ